MLIEILVGLPGSGKTYYANEQYEKAKDSYGFYSNLQLVDVDHANLSLGMTTDEDVLMHCRFNPKIRKEERGWKHWIFDGLFITNASQNSLVNAISEYKQLFKDKREHVTIKFVVFKENREVCLYNDSFRPKERQGRITIERARFEMPMIDALKTDYPYFKFEIEEREIHKMTTWDIYFAKHVNNSNRNCKHLMTSEEWTVRGEWGDCWGNGGDIDPDPVPTRFEEFFDLIETACPKISLRDACLLYDTFVSIGEREEVGYYGSWEDKNFYQCDLDALYEKMIEMNLISE